MDTDELTAEFHATDVRDLLRTAYMLTHQMHAMGICDELAHKRRLRNMIDAEIERRCAGA